MTLTILKIFHTAEHTDDVEDFADVVERFANLTGRPRHVTVIAFTTRSRLDRVHQLVVGLFPRFYR